MSDSTIEIADFFTQWERTTDEPREVGAPTDSQAQLLAKCVALYRRRGVFSRVDNNPPLETSCERCKACWRDPSGYNGGQIVLPYVGPQYRAGGVVVLGMNLRDGNYALLNEYAITDEAYANLSAGRHESHNSPFAYGSTRSAAAVMDWLDGADIGNRTEPQDLAPVLLRTARVQAVKCCPSDTSRGGPYDRMYRPCWETYVVDELAILQPRVVLSLGRSFSEQVLHSPLSEPYSHGHGVEELTLPLSWGEVRIFTTYHPVHAGWLQSHERLLEVLAATTP